MSTMLVWVVYPMLFASTVYGTVIMFKAEAACVSDLIANHFHDIVC
jgi:hypothetical protein